MLSAFLRIITLICGLATTAAWAQGTIPLSLVQQFDVNGRPLAGCQVYFYVAGTVATPQNSFQDFGLTQLNPNPLSCDQSGRVPLFWLNNGLIHVRLTDASGVVQLDTTMQVLGPSSGGGGGGGGGGGSVDPTTVFSTGDIKFRPTSETLSGWVKMNGQTVGSATSGASGRANADTQSLFVYLWSNCHLCTVAGGKGASGLADFNANKKITVPDWRGRGPAGLDDMGNSAAGILQPKNVTSTGDNVTTAGATGGEAVHTLVLAEAPKAQFTLSFTDPGHTHTITQQTSAGLLTHVGFDGFASGGSLGIAGSTNSATTGITASIADHAGGGNHNVHDPMMLGTWYLKL
jgi:hypothetical protein